VIDTFLIVLPLMLSPGPANLVSFTLAARVGFARVLMFQLGILVVYALVSITLGLLANEVSGSVPYGTATLQLLGGLFIGYLGLRLASRKQPDLAGVEGPSFLSGAILQILNPKYPAVVLAVFASRAEQPPLTTTGIIVAVGAAGLLIYSFAGSLVRSLLPAEKHLRVLDVAFGLLLGVVGIWIAAQAFIPG
jgi:threonine/homoserine/homoserine lactone efflux protein